jgi:hypothetical protein
VSTHALTPALAHLEQRLVVGADVEHDRQHAVRRDPARADVQRELACAWGGTPAVSTP